MPSFYNNGYIIRRSGGGSSARLGGKTESHLPTAALSSESSQDLIGTRAYANYAPNLGNVLLEDVLVMGQSLLSVSPINIT